MDKKIVMIRTVGGEFIIGYEDTATIVSEDGMSAVNNPNRIRLTDARIFNIQMTARGAAIAFMPPFPFTKTPIKSLENLDLDQSIVILKVDESHIDSEILNGYKQNVTGIDMSAANPGVII